MRRLQQRVIDARLPVGRYGQGLMSTLVTRTGDSPICTRPFGVNGHPVGQSPGHSPLVNLADRFDCDCAKVEVMAVTKL